LQVNNQIGNINENADLLNKGKHTIEVYKSVSNGYCMLILSFLFIFCSMAITGVTAAFIPVIIPLGMILFILGFIFCKGLFQIAPNEAYILTYFGKYLGTVKNVGYFWVNPCYNKHKISLKRNIFRSEVIKVNDKSGNPIMVGCIVVWRVKDTARAFFDVQDYRYYVRVQTETAIRYIGCKYPYEKTEKDQICLRMGHDEINRELKRELAERLGPAGIQVDEAYINEMSYAPEIATVMLKRQSAQAIIAAREKIVQGAVSIAGHAVNSLKENNICELNDDEKSDIVSNLILVLCTEAEVRPVVNAGAGSSQ